MKIELSEKDLKQLSIDGFIFKIMKSNNIIYFCDEYWTCNIPGSKIINDRVLIFCSLSSAKEFISNGIINKFISLIDNQRLIISNPGGTKLFKNKLIVEFEEMK